MVAIEKETKLKEYMLMMGLSRNALWASWYLHYFLLLIIPCLLTMVVLTGNLSSYGSVLQMSDSFIVFIFLMLWESFFTVCLFHRSLGTKTENCTYETLKGCSLISLGFLISSFFSKANTVSSMSGLIIWLCAIPYDFVKNDMENQTSGLSSLRLKVRTRSDMERPSVGRTMIRNDSFYSIIWSFKYVTWLLCYCCLGIKGWRNTMEQLKWANQIFSLSYWLRPSTGGRQWTSFGDLNFFLGTPISPSLDLNMSSVFIYFIINTILYHILTRYMDLGIRISNYCVIDIT